MNEKILPGETQTEKIDTMPDSKIRFAWCRIRRIAYDKI
jgi:hypothetical protein